ncbi:hypothetical protein M404DRAFT_40957, partial [Pisolithus tinctorius Marx 270]
WTPHDLDLYTTQRNVDFLLCTLKLQGYHMIYVNTTNDVHYYNSLVATVFTITREECKIDIIVSTSLTAVSPIFRYHSTALMNFISHDCIFCTYPKLTLKQCSFVNPFVIFSQALKRSTLEALLKYHDRGIRYLKCIDVHHGRCCCKHNLHSIHDHSCMWMQL